MAWRHPFSLPWVEGEAAEGGRRESWRSSEALKLGRLQQRFPLGRQGGAEETPQLPLLSWGRGPSALVAEWEFQRAQAVS